MASPEKMTHDIYREAIILIMLIQRKYHIKTKVVILKIGEVIFSIKTGLPIYSNYCGGSGY